MRIRTRIYLAGSYSADNILGVLNNIKIGNKIAAKYIKDGYAVFSPFLDYQFHFFEDLSITDYYEYSLAFLEVCDEMWVLPNWENSKGTKMEIEFALNNQIPIKYLREEDLWLLKKGKPL